MKRTIIRRTACALALFPIAVFSHAKGTGSSGGLTLLQSPSARSSALAEAYSTAKNDVAAYVYNPSSLISLQNKQASFLYQNGIGQESYGQLLLGGPMQSGLGWGASLGYYDGGSFSLDDGQSIRTVKAQTDILFSLGMARQLSFANIGFTAKYLTSELIESKTAQAMAIDMGAIVPMGTRWRLGGSLQNLGTDLKYDQDGDPLPYVLRGGMSYDFLSAALPTVAYLDLPYHINEREWEQAIGVESRAGLLAIRGGLTHRAGETNFTTGMGVLFGQTTFDYAFAFQREFDSEHRISIAMEFGAKPVPAFVAKPAPPPALAEPAPTAAAAPPPAPTEKKSSRAKRTAEKAVPPPPVAAAAQTASAAAPVVAQAAFPPPTPPAVEKAVAAAPQAATAAKPAEVWYFDPPEFARGAADSPAPTAPVEEKVYSKGGAWPEPIKVYEPEEAKPVPQRAPIMVAQVPGEEIAYAQRPPARRMYLIKEGDTLEKIAFHVYGDREEWRKIFLANKDIMAHRRDLKPGQRIVLP